METFTFTDFDRAAAIADGVISTIKAEQFADPTPCTEWTVRDLVNHLVTGNMLFRALVLGDPPPERAADHLGDDPAAAWRASLDQLRQAFTGEGVLEREFTSPIGERPGRVLLGMRVNEMVVHSWDLARATGQSTDIDPPLAGACLAAFQSAPLPRGERSLFGAETPVPAGATAADRLAAYVGRTV